jgi:formate hydrogenlyase subunit 3/multisubunit Na+/H+ antiporter MnhD subunit
VSADGVLALIPVVPLLAAIAAFAVSRAGRWIGLAASAVSAFLAVWLAAQILDQGTVTHVVGGWAAPLGIRLRADGLSALLLLAVSVVGLLVSVYSHGYFGPASAGPSGHRARYFWPLWMFLLAALGAMLLAGDAFNLYVTLELQGLSAVALVALDGKPAALRAALRYLFVSLVGSMLYLLGVALLYGGFGTVDLALLAQRMSSEPYSLVALATMTGGLLMKAALFPMHFWLPPAHSRAPAPVSAALSALVIKGGFYVLLRLWFEPFGTVISPGASQWLGLLGAAAIVWGSVQALSQDRLKLLIAYSTVAQLGYLFLMFPLALRPDTRAEVWTGGLVFLLSHATAKAAMFLAAGNVQRAAGDDRIEALDGMTRRLPISTFAMGLAGVSLVGLPPSAGFVGKWLLIVASLEQGQWWWVAAILGGSLLAAAYVTRLLSHAFTRAPERPTGVSIPYRMEWPAFVLALLSVILGLFAAGPARMLGEVLSGGGAP